MADEIQRVEIDRVQGWTRVKTGRRAWQADGVAWCDDPPPEVLKGCRDAAKHLNALAPARKRASKPKPKPKG